MVSCVDEKPAIQALGADAAEGVFVIVHPSRHALKRKALGFAGILLPDWLIGRNTCSHVLIASPGRTSAGHLTSVDMQATLKEKLGAQFRKYSILGACNPPLAQRTVAQDLEAGLVLPCTVVICEDDHSSSTSIADPMSVANMLGNLASRPIAQEAQAS